VLQIYGFSGTMPSESAKTFAVSRKMSIFALAMRRNILTALVLALLAFLAACTNQAERDHYAQIISEADSMNRHYITITTDSLLLDACRFYDRHGNSNEQVRAHYLLGCAYRDMGEAPRAIDCYLDAAFIADTMSTDCDFHTLGCAYSQMADLFYQQLLLTNSIEARQKAIHYADLAGDTLSAVSDLKFLAGTYVLSGNSALAERHLLTVIHLYEKYGYAKDALVATFPLMHLYARMPEKKKNLQTPIDSYESSYTLLGNEHLSSPLRKRYYYYKGRFFEETHQLDSADCYYRMVYYPNMPYSLQDSMYKGLLRLFEQRHNADSIAKYAQLYGMASDSSVIVKDQQTTAQLAACYNYNGLQRESKANELKARRANNRTMALLSVLLVVTAIASFLILRGRKKRKEQASVLIKNIFERVRLQEELNSLKARNYDAVIIQKEQEIDALGKIIAEQQAARNMALTKDRLSDFKNSQIVAIFVSNKIPKKDGETLLKRDWDKLESEFSKTMPIVYTTMKTRNGGLSKLQLHVCIFLLLDFEVGEIATLKNTQPQTINTAKVRANQKLFNSADSSSLADHLRQMVAQLSADSQ